MDTLKRGSIPVFKGGLLSTISRQLLLVGAVVMAFVVIVSAALLSQGSEPATPRDRSTKQFTVDRSRNAAQGMASSDRRVDGASGTVSSSQPVQSLTPNAKPNTTRIQVPVGLDDADPLMDNEEKVSPRIAAIITEAYAADTAQLAQELLIRELARAQAPEDTSTLYSAIGALHLAQASPDTDAGLAALRQATETATSPEMRSKAAIAEASALVLHAKTEEGLSRIDEMLVDDEIDAEGTHHLTLLRGDLLVDQGDLRAAESEYETVRRAATPANATSSKFGDALFRQASLRLARLYARTGDEKKEAIIERDLKQAITSQH